MGGSEAEVSTLDALAREALTLGIKQVEAAGSPLHPFFLDETRRVCLLYTEGAVDPMQLLMPALRENLPGIQRCALVIDSRITGGDGKKWDAIVVMACERDKEEGLVLAHRYVPKGWFRKFRTEGEQEQIAACRNFIRAAFEEPA
jgi:hypothetical protein